MLVFFRCSFWLAALFWLLTLPLLIAPMFEVDYHDPARCTLSGDVCSRLAQR